MADSNVRGQAVTEAAEEKAEGERQPSRKGQGLRVAALLIVLVGLAATVALLPVKRYLLAFLEWSTSLGAWGPVLIALAYVPASLLFLPGSILTLGAGLVCGLVKGTIAVSLGSTAGASLAFLAGRTLARRWVEQKVSGNPRFRAIDAAVGQSGFKIVLLTRLSPAFPFNLLNYAYGLTKVRFRSYLMASWIGMLPGTILYVYLGSALKSLAEVATGKVSGGSARVVFFAVGLVATIAVTVYITRVARRALREAGRPGPTA